MALLAIGGVGAAVPRTFLSGLWLQAAGGAALGAGGAIAFLGGESAGSSFSSVLTPRVGVDPLSGFFLAMLGLVAAPVLVYATAYLRPDPRGRAAGALLSPFVLALVAVFCARDAVTFLLGWELMTLIPAAIILAWSSGTTGRRVVFVYLAVTHLGGTGVWVALLLLASHGALGGPSLDPGSGLAVAVTLAALVGFGTKAGAIPLHAWLPRAHPLAPAPVSALMSGVMVKVGLYGLVRVLLEWIGPARPWLGALVIAVGAVSAVAGIVYALFQRGFKRLLAFSTIDNVGIALLGLGACLLFRAHGEQGWAAIALAAALLHALNHAAVKALLFLGAGSLERAAGTVDLDALGGLLRRMPRTGAAVLVGCAAIAGLPPFSVFASEWLAAQSLVHVPGRTGPVAGIVGAVALAALAATAAVALFCFVKVAGLALLGTPKRAASAAATEVAPAMWSATAVLATLSVVLGLAPGPIFERLARLMPGAPELAVGLGVDLPGSGGLRTPVLAGVLVVLFGVIATLRRSPTAASSPTWACGQELAPQLHWTGAGFTKSLRLVLEAVLRPRREITVIEQGGVVRSASYTGRVPQLVDEWLYRPTTAAALSLAAVARRLQSGRLGTYVAYLVWLLLVSLGAVKLGVIG
ncbi:MAG: proton-conducting transporter membrane subunit [Gaiellales bacterium]